MIIQNVKIAGFKNVKETSIDLNKMTSLLSLNSYGKSNVINGISFGFDFITQTNDTKRRMLSWRPGFPLNRSIDTDIFKFSFLALHTTDQMTYQIEYSYSFRWNFNENSQPKVIHEMLRIKQDEPNQVFSNYINRDVNGSFYKPSETARCSKSILIDDYSLIINKLLAFDDLFYRGIIVALNNVRVFVDRHFDSTQNFEHDIIVGKDDNQLGLIHDSNLPRALFHLKLKYPDSYAQLVDVYKQLFPFINDIEIKELKVNYETESDIPDHLQISNTLYQLLAHDKYIRAKLSFQELSDGARRILLLLTNLVLAEINNVSLICIEEPENSINPALLQKYLSAIYEFSSHCKILFTSHSSHLLSYFEPDSLYVGIPNDERVAIFRKIKKTAIKKLLSEARSLDLTIGDYLFDLLDDCNDEQEILNYVEKR